MKTLKTIIASAALLLTATTIQAQHTESGYFTDGYLFRHEMNPALANEQNYISMPVIGNLDLNLHGDLSITDILYNVNGRTALFTNPSVSASEFIGNIQDKNKLGTDFKIQLLGTGFKAFGGYNTISVNVRSNSDFTIPGSLLTLAKKGLSNKRYDIKDFNLHSDAYAEVAFGHSRQINEQWRIGGALKVLLGGGNIDAHFDKAEIDFNGEDWTAVTNATVEASVKGLSYKTKTTNRGPEGNSHTFVNGAEINGAGLNGCGVAVDLGAEFKLNDDWKFSAALIDLGLISWQNNLTASTNGNNTFALSKYTFNVDGDANNSFDKEIDRLTEDLASLFELKNNGDKGSRSTKLGATINVGVEYILPVYRKISFGLLSTTRLLGDNTWTDCRLSANWKTAEFFSMGINAAYGTFGSSLGWIVNLHPKGFNLFLAMDHVVGEVSKQYIPLSSNASASMGINFPF